MPNIHIVITNIWAIQPTYWANCVSGLEQDITKLNLTSGIKAQVCNPKKMTSSCSQIIAIYMYMYIRNYMVLTMKICVMAKKTFDRDACALVYIRVYVC